MVIFIASAILDFSSIADKKAGDNMTDAGTYSLFWLSLLLGYFHRRISARTSFDVIFWQISEVPRGLVASSAPNTCVSSLR